MAPSSSSKLQEMFHEMDEDTDGVVSLECLQRQLLKTTGVSITKDELVSLIGKSSLNVEEFTLLYNSIEIQNDIVFKGQDDDKEEEEDCVKKAFMVFDVNGDGFICGEELEIVLKRLGIWGDDDKSGGKNKNPAAMICKFDKNSDGLLDFEEFKTMVMSQ
ncbi:Probable calcium-binding protein CML44 [Linum perenne]